MRESQRIDFIEMQSRIMRLRYSKYRAINSEGKYLHLSGEGFTSDRLLAWRGNKAQFEAVCAICPEPLEMREVREEEKVKIWRTMYE